MLTIDQFLNQQEKEIFLYYNLDICKWNNEYTKLKIYFKHKYRSDGELKKRKYMNNLKRRIEEKKEEIYELKIERMLENMFYYKKDLNEKNINLLNNDLLNIIDEYDFCQLNYIFYKMIDEDNYKITSDIDSIKTLLQEGWIEYIYVGDYKNIFNTNDIQKQCQKVFDKNTMEFNKINLALIRRTNYVYRIQCITQQKNTNGICNRFIRDLNDYFEFEDYITKNNIDIKSLELLQLQEIDSMNVYSDIFLTIHSNIDNEKISKVFAKSFKDKLFKSLYSKLHIFLSIDMN